MSTALFETIRVRSGAVPLLERHLRRLHDSARAVGLEAPPESLGMAVLSWAREHPDDHIVRIEWDGHDVEWSDRDVPAATALRVVTVGEPHPGYPVKAVARGAFDRALLEAADRTADEPLLLATGGCVGETARFAVLWLEGERLCYPDPDLGVLPSLGLARVLELAAEAGLEGQAVRAPRTRLDGRPGWLVNAARGVVAMATLDGESVPQPAVLDGLSGRFWPHA